MAMKAPVHPGIIAKEGCMKPLSLSVTDAAGKLLSENLDDAKASDLVDRSIQEIKQKLH